MLWLTPTIAYLDRAAWGARTDLERRGYTPTRDGRPIREQRTSISWHHGAGVGDTNDDTPNTWETIPEVTAKMRRYQTVRWNPGQPDDLGPDVPYNEVMFPMAGGWIIICEGRGRDRISAATRRHNTRTHSLCVPGDWERWRTDFGPWVPAASRYMGILQEAMPTIIRLDGHTNYPHNSTICPGTAILDVLPQITFDHGRREDDMLTQFLTFEKMAGLGRVFGEVYLAGFGQVTGGPVMTQAQKNILIAIGEALKQERDGQGR